VASALLIRPDLAEKLVVVWLGGHPLSWSNNHEFNFQQDPFSVQVVLDSGVPFIQIPCVNVAEHIRTTAAEMEVLFKGKGAIGDYLCDIYREFIPTIPGVSKVIWDLSAIAWLLEGEFFQSITVSAPNVKLDESLAWSETEGRHLIRTCTRLDRDRVFRDMVRRLDAYLKLK
jgi:purine nucleosidase